MRILLVVAKKVAGAFMHAMTHLGTVLYPTAESRAIARPPKREPPPLRDLPPGHPERMPTDPAPTAVERLLWDQLQDGEHWEPRGEP